MTAMPLRSSLGCVRRSTKHENRRDGRSDRFSNSSCGKPGSVLAERSRASDWHDTLPTTQPEVRNAIRGLERVIASQPQVLESGQPQRARHMSAVRPGTVMLPCPRGPLSRTARDSSRRHQDVERNPSESASRYRPWMPERERCTVDGAKHTSDQGGIALSEAGMEHPQNCTSPAGRRAPHCPLPSHQPCMYCM